MGNTQGHELDFNKQGVWWGWWFLIGVIMVCAVCVIVTPSSQVNETESVAIHTTEAAPNPETFRQRQRLPVDKGQPGQFAERLSSPLSDHERFATEIRENYLDYPTDGPFTSPPPIWTSPAPVITSPPPIWTSPAPVITSPPPDTEEPGCPSEIPGEYPDALDPVFRQCQSQKLAACYAKCHSINPLYFLYNP